MVTEHRGGHREFNWINLDILIAMFFGSLTYAVSQRLHPDAVGSLCLSLTTFQDQSW